MGVGVGWGGWGRQGKHFHRNGSPVEKVRIEEILFRATVKYTFGETAIPHGKAQKQDKFSAIL